MNECTVVFYFMVRVFVGTLRLAKLRLRYPCLFKNNLTLRLDVLSCFVSRKTISFVYLLLGITGSFSGWVHQNGNYEIL